MPIRVTTTIASGDTAYGSIRIGDKQTTHQRKLNASGLASARDAAGFLPPGLPILASGLPVSGASQVVTDIIGPEAVPLGAVDVFGNTFKNGPLSRDMIESNLGRALSANELSAIAAGGFILV